MCDAQMRVARRMGYNLPKPSRGLKDRFWGLVFVPIYRILPWSIRRAVMLALPGSHRHAWPKRTSPPLK